MRTVVQSEQTASPPPGYSQAVLVEGRKLYFISGQGPVDAEGQTVGEGDLRAQCHQVFRNLQAQLATVGADFSHVVKFTFFLTDAAMHEFAVFRQVRLEYLHGDYPAASTVGVSALVDSRWLLEAEAVAVLE